MSKAGGTILERNLPAEIARLGKELQQTEHLLAAVATKLGGVVLTARDLQSARPFGVVGLPTGGVAIVVQDEPVEQPRVVVPNLRVNGH